MGGFGGVGITNGTSREGEGKRGKQCVRWERGMSVFVGIEVSEKVSRKKGKGGKREGRWLSVNEKGVQD